MDPLQIFLRHGTNRKLNFAMAQECHVVVAEGLRHCLTAGFHLVQNSALLTLGGDWNLALALLRQIET